MAGNRRPRRDAHRREAARPSARRGARRIAHLARGRDQLARGRRADFAEAWQLAVELIATSSSLTKIVDGAKRAPVEGSGRRPRREHDSGPPRSATHTRRGRRGAGSRGGVVSGGRSSRPVRARGPLRVNESSDEAEPRPGQLDDHRGDPRDGVGRDRLPAGDPLLRGTRRRHRHRHEDRDEHSGTGTPEEAAEEAFRWFGATFVAYSGSTRRTGDDDLVPYGRPSTCGRSSTPRSRNGKGEHRRAEQRNRRRRGRADGGEHAALAHRGSDPRSDSRGEDSDVFGAQRADLIGYLSFEKARPFRMPGDQGDVGAQRVSRAGDRRDASVRCPGPRTSLSAPPRSIDHFRAWLWLLGDEMLRFADDGDNYPMYGKPILRRICEKYGFEWSASLTRLLRICITAPERAHPPRVAEVLDAFDRHGSIGRTFAKIVRKALTESTEAAQNFASHADRLGLRGHRSEFASVDVLAHPIRTRRWAGSASTARAVSRSSRSSR